MRQRYPPARAQGIRAQVTRHKSQGKSHKKESNIRKQKAQKNMDTEGSENSIIFNRGERREFLDRITEFFATKTLRHKGIRPQIKRIHRRERKGRRVYKYMHIYLWSILCFETKIARTEDEGRKTEDGRRKGTRA